MWAPNCIILNLADHAQVLRKAVSMATEWNTTGRIEPVDADYRTSDFARALLAHPPGASYPPRAKEDTADCTGASGAVDGAVVAEGSGPRPAFLSRPARPAPQRCHPPLSELGRQFSALLKRFAVVTIAGDPGSGKASRASFQLLAALQRQAPRSVHGIAAVMDQKGSR